MVKEMPSKECGAGRSNSAFAIATYNQIREWLNYFKPLN
jgi:hypothetical protein